MTQVKPGAIVLAAVLAAAAPAWAAGGHHAVDDAAILEPRQCESESWVAHGRGARPAAHTGLNCRVGPAEFGLAAEYARDQGTSATGWQAQAKWATQLTDSLSVGASLAPTWQARLRPRYQGITAIALISADAGHGMSVHANLGRDYVHRGPGYARWGVGIEWAVRDAFVISAERFAQEEGQFLRAGLRWPVGERLMLDVSHAHHLGGEGRSTWTAAVSWLFDRP